MVKHTQTIHWLLLTNCLSVFDYLVGLMLKVLVYARDICDLLFWSMIPIPTCILIKVLQHIHYGFKKKLSIKLYLRKILLIVAFSAITR